VSTVASAPLMFNKNLRTELREGTSPSVRHRVPSRFNWSLPQDYVYKRRRPLTMYINVIVI